MNLAILKGLSAQKTILPDFNPIKVFDLEVIGLKIHNSTNIKI